MPSFDSTFIPGEKIPATGHHQQGAGQSRISSKEKLSFPNDRISCRRAMSACSALRCRPCIESNRITDHERWTQAVGNWPTNAFPKLSTQTLRLHSTAILGQGVGVIDQLVGLLFEHEMNSL
jgi:hypothetical protein